MQTFGTGEILATKRKQKERKCWEDQGAGRIYHTETVVALGVGWESPWEDGRVDESNGICHIGS